MVKRGSAQVTSEKIRERWADPRLYWEVGRQSNPASERLLWLNGKEGHPRRV